MMAQVARRFDRAFKVAALERMAAGADVSALGRELGVRRKLLYQWRDTVRRGGAPFSKTLEILSRGGSSSLSRASLFASA